MALPPFIVSKRHSWDMWFVLDSWWLNYLGHIREHPEEARPFPQVLASDSRTVLVPGSSPGLQQRPCRLHGSDCPSLSTTPLLANSPSPLCDDDDRLQATPSFPGFFLISFGEAKTVKMEN